MTKREKKVSMPCVGLIPFLPIKHVHIVLNHRLCQCPVSGLFHFYTIFPMLFSIAVVCVNALCRAYSISTA